MASLIDNTAPATNADLVSEPVRTNFGHAKSEIEALQGKVDATDGTITTGTIELGHADDTTLARASAGVVNIEGVPIVTTTATQTLTNKTIGAATLSGTLNGGSQEIARNRTRVVTGVSGTLTTGNHSGCLLVTSGNVTVPTTNGFHAVIVAGGAHTVTFNSTVSAAMASGDVMTVFVQSETVIHAVLTAAANKVAFS
jgi:hypothetical protein